MAIIWLIIVSIMGLIFSFFYGASSILANPHRQIIGFILFILSLAGLSAGIALG
ncbi:MAG: hypothetical protein WC178_01485 [Candidatus Paceibacterota bacterium]